MAQPSPQQVLDFWFGRMDADGVSPESERAKWFSGEAEFDELVKREFGALVEAAERGELSAWTDEPEAALALVLLVDQFTRNIYRDNPRMYASDALAVEVATSMIAAGKDRQLGMHPRVFLYMPLMHAENVGHQELGVKMFRQLAEEVDDAHKQTVQMNLKFCVAHHDVVARFGRFPHRNEILGRQSTEEEVTFLEKEGRGF